jgi:hypothetical protein
VAGSSWLGLESLHRVEQNTGPGRRPSPTQGTECPTAAAWCSMRDPAEPERRSKFSSPAPFPTFRASTTPHYDSVHITEDRLQHSHSVNIMAIVSCFFSMQLSCLFISSTPDWTSFSFIYPSPIPKIVSTCLIFIFTYMCIEYFHHIHPPTLFLISSPPPTANNPTERT